MCVYTTYAEKDYRDAVRDAQRNAALEAAQRQYNYMQELQREDSFYIPAHLYFSRAKARARHLDKLKSVSKAYRDGEVRYVKKLAVSRYRLGF